MMSEQYYQGYLAGYANLGGRSGDPEWLAAYDQAREDNGKSVVNSEVYKRFHGSLPGKTEISKQSTAQGRMIAE